MDYVKLDFTFINDAKKREDEAIELLDFYLSVLYKNGQILKNYELTSYSKGFHAYVTLPEKDSLNKTHNNKYADESLLQIEKLFYLGAEIVGENIIFDIPCSCAEPSWFMLYADWTLENSPVACGDCGRQVPLYKLPHFPDEHDEHFDLLQWQRSYRSIDYIWREGLADRFSYRQRNNPTSQLAKEGRRLCAELEKVTDKAFYYFIFLDKKNQDNCPGCGAPWDVVEDNFIDFRCEKCRLVSNRVDERGIIAKQILGR